MAERRPDSRDPERTELLQRRRLRTAGLVLRTAGRALWTRQEENGSSMEDLRLQDPPLYRKRASASVDDASSSRHRDDQEDQEQKQEQPRQKLGNCERRAGDCREPEKRGDEADHQEYKSHVEHGATLRSSVLRKPCRRPEPLSWGKIRS